MVLNNCYGLLKYILVFVNLIFWAIGLATVVLAIWMIVDNTFLVSLVPDQQNFYNGLYILLAAGGLMLFVSFLGCCGAIRESQCLLVCFFSCLLIVIVAQIAAGAWLYTNSDRLRELVKSNIMITIKNEYGVMKQRTEIVDTFQEHFDCCGAIGPGDWAGSKYNRRESNRKDSVISLTVSHDKNVFRVPESCCKIRDTDECNRSRDLLIGGPIPYAISNDGCTDKLLNLMEKNSCYFLYFLLGVCAVELLGLLFALVICCAIGSTERYKA